ncbi:MAG: molybdenum cofactor guanylyltransferase [Desulfatitalea sp.]|nr:molybdenum cofactor guanylyltransferase [Desulfatitalea sp.]NNK02057.1 molybdenum cofactor guanylyltransferase [Desulfatitalea sp.]
MRVSSNARSCCAVILAGGRNQRMAGRHKAFIEVAGRAVLDRLAQVLNPYFSEILLVTRRPELFTGRPFRVVADIFQERTSLTGIHAGLAQAEAQHALVVPCDAPFLQPALVQLLLDSVTPHSDVVIPVIGGYYEPLCAVYAKTCLPAITANLTRGAYKITGFFSQVSVKTLSEQQIRQADPGLYSFLNANTPEEFERLSAADPAKGQ